MAKTYVICQGNSASDSEVLQYATSLWEAKRMIVDTFNVMPNCFILMLKGNYFGEGFHKYTLELMGGKYKKNTRL